MHVELTLEVEEPRGIVADGRLCDLALGECKGTGAAGHGTPERGMQIDQLRPVADQHFSPTLIEVKVIDLGGDDKRSGEGKNPAHIAWTALANKPAAAVPPTDHLIREFRAAIGRETAIAPCTGVRLTGRIKRALRVDHPLDHEGGTIVGMRSRIAVGIIGVWPPRFPKWMLVASQVTSILRLVHRRL